MLTGKGAVARAMSIVLAVAIALGCVSSLVGCTAEKQQPADERQVITLYLDMNNYGIWYEKLRARFPEVNFKALSSANNDNAAEISRRIEHDDLPDIILSNYLDRSIPNLTEHLLDLSGKDYTASYMTSFLDNANFDGAIYYLPSQITASGLSVDKTLFLEKGWAVPESFDQFIASCDTIEAAGMDPALITFGEDYAADIFYRMLMVNVGYKLEGAAWIQQFNNQEASLSDIDLSAVFDDIERMAQAGALSPEDTLASAPYWAFLGQATREIGYIENTGGFVNTVAGSKQGDEFEMMPYYGSANEEGYLFAQPQVYIAVSEHVAEDAAKEAKVDEILSYINSEEGQRSIMDIASSVISPILGVSETIDDPLLSRVLPLLEEERLLVLPTFQNCHDVLSDMMARFVTGEVTREEVIAAVDEANKRPPEEGAAAQEPAVATATADFTYEQTSGLALDALRHAVDADFALSYYVDQWRLEAQKACIGGKIYAGDVTATDLRCVSARFSNVIEQPRINILQMTGHQLVKALETENALFYTGFAVEYAWDEERNAYRAVGLLDEEGNALDLDATYRVAMQSSMTVGESLYESLGTVDLFANDAMAAYIEELGVLDPAKVKINELVEK